MPIQTDSEFEEMIANAAKVRKDAPHDLLQFFDSMAPNFRNYPGSGTDEPVPTIHIPQQMHKIYFYYFAFDRATSRLISYVYEGNAGDLVHDIDGWIDDARNNGGAGAHARDFDLVDWNGPCYLAFAVDAEGWSFVEGMRDGRPVNRSLYFHEATFPRGRIVVDHRKNETFFNAMTLSGAVLPVLLVENHHFKYGANRARVINDTIDHYKFDIYCRVAFQPKLMRGNEELKLTLVIDPTGKNTGPP